MKWKKLEEFLPADEIEFFLREIKEGETPIWEHWDCFVRDRFRYGRSHSGLRSTRSGLRVLVRHAGIRSIEQANSREFKKAIEQYQDSTGISGVTFNVYRKNLNTYLIWLEEEELIDSNYIKNSMPKVTVKNKEQRCYTQEQINHIESVLNRRDSGSAFHRKRDLLMFQLLSITGMRGAELRGMKLDDIYNDSVHKKWMIRVDGKKQKGRIRYYDCPNSLRDLLLEYLQHRPKTESDALFVSDAGKPLSRNTLGSFYKRVSRDVGFKVSGHSIRRYVATELHRRGVDILTIMRHLGHTRQSTTEKYICRSGVLTAESTRAMVELNQFR